MNKYNNVPISDFCIEIVDCLNRTAPVVEKTTPFKMIRTSNVRNGFVDLSECRRVTKETYEKWTRRRKPTIGDIVLTREAPLGNVGIIREENTFLGQRTVQYVIDEEIADKFFLMYYLMSYQGQAQIKALGSGSTVHHMRVPDSKKIMIPNVPLKIQKKVGFILSQYDELIINNNKKIEILEEIAQRLYEEWFLHFKFPGHEKVKMTDSELGKIPEGWEVGKIQRIFKFDGGFSFKSEDYVKNGSYKIITIKNVDDGVFINETNSRVDELPNKLKDNQKLKEGDVLLSLTGNVGRVCMVYGDNNVLNQRVAKVTSKDNLHYYAYCFFRNPILKKRMENLSHGVAQQNLSTLKLSKEDVVIPKVELRREFNSIVAPILKLKLNLLKKNQRLSNMRDLLLPRLISGEIEV